MIMNVFIPAHFEKKIQSKSRSQLIEYVLWLETQHPPSGLSPPVKYFY